MPATVPPGGATANALGSTSVLPPPLLPSGAQAFAHVETLAGVIGPRLVGTAGHDAAANYLTAQWEKLGYRVQRQPFVARFQEDRSTLTVRNLPGDARVLALNRSATGSIEAPLFDAGRAEPSDIPAGGLAGRVALVERGGITFQEKVENVTRAGALAAIIYNNQEGLFGGTLRETSGIPVVSLSRATGLALSEALSRGVVSVRIEANVATVEQPALNILARPNEEPCAWLVGGHYDTVADAPGASDNASGISVALEVARAMAALADDLQLCFIAFDAEEEGLFGSSHFVNALGGSDRGALRAFINLDTVGVGTEWQAIGTAALAEALQAAGRDLSLAIGRQDLPPNASSDHASFIREGLPAVFLYRADDDLIHTPQDQVSRVPAATLEEAARIVIRFLQRAATA